MHQLLCEYFLTLCLPACRAMCHSFTTADTQEQRGQTYNWGARTSVTSAALSSSLLFSTLPQHTYFPLPLPSLSFMLSLSALSPQIGPAVHQPPRRSPSCLTSPNEEPNNNTGHRSRERTGCVHNRPVAPTKTIIPFSFPALLHCCQDWKWQIFGGVAEGNKGGVLLENSIQKHLPLFFVFSFFFFTIGQRTTRINTLMHFIFALCRPVLCLFQEPSCPSAQSWKSKLILRSLVEWYKCFRNFASFTWSLDWCILIAALLNFYPFTAIICWDCVILIFVKANLLSYYIASFIHMCCVSKKTQVIYHSVKLDELLENEFLPFSVLAWARWENGTHGRESQRQRLRAVTHSPVPRSCFPMAHNSLPPDPIETPEQAFEWHHAQTLSLSHTHALTHILQQISISQPQSTPSSSLADFPFFF